MIFAHVAKDIKPSSRNKLLDLNGFLNDHFHSVGRFQVSITGRQKYHRNFEIIAVQKLLMVIMEFHEIKQQTHNSVEN